MVKGYDKELERLLRKAGCIIHRPGKGAHTVWRSPVNGAIFPVPKGIMSRHMANAILGQAGLDKAF